MRRHAAATRKGIGFRRGFAFFAGAALVVFLVLVGVCLFQARTAYAELRAAIPAVAQLREQALSGAPSVERTAHELQTHTAAARGALSGPHWRLLALAPVIGDDVAAVRAVTEVVDDLAHGAVAKLVDAVAVVDPAALTPVDGRVDLGPLEAARPNVVAAQDSIAMAQDRLGAIDTESLTPPIANRVDDLTGKVDEMASLTATAARAVELLPPMLGGEGERNYLLLVQNNAEPRASGGLAGAILHVRANGGQLEVIEHRAAVEFPRFDPPVIELPTGERGLFGTLPARFFGNVTYTPDFPRSGELAREMWRLDTGRDVDGVASIDPVALGYLLGATGPVTLPTGAELTEGNAAQVLLNQVYLDITDPAMQDAVYEAAAAAVFDQLLGGRELDAPSVIAALDRAADEGRLLVWSAHAEEQERLADTVLSGAVRGHAGDSPVVGIYLNDNSAAKLGFYQRMEAAVEAKSCSPEGAGEFAVTVTVTSEVPEPVEHLPESVTGTGWASTPGHLESTVYVYAPTGGLITNVSASDGNTAVSSSRHNELAAVARRIVLAPGESITLGFDITMDERFPGEPLVRMTPGASPDSFSASVSPCAGE